MHAGTICQRGHIFAIKVDHIVLLCPCVIGAFTIVKMGGIWTTCRISKLCAFIISEWSLSKVPLFPPVQQSRVRRLGRLPLSPLYAFTQPPHSQCRSKGSRLCACFITSIPLRLERLYHVSSNSPRERHFQPQSGVQYPCRIIKDSEKSFMFVPSTGLKPDRYPILQH